MIKNPVIVMALYDIGRDNWNNFTMSYHTYLHWMKNTLSLDANIVIYTEQKFIDTIKQYRREFDPLLQKTIIIEKPLSELDAYILYFDKLSNLMNSDEFKNKISHDVPEMTRPLYNIVMFNKCYFLKDVKDKNYFNADLLIWADAGGLRENINNYLGSKWPCLEKINRLNNNNISFFSHSNNINIHNIEDHALSQSRFIQGTCFFVPSKLIDSFVLSCHETIIKCINNNFIGSDEKIFDLVYINNPQQYNLIKCSWREYFQIFAQHNIKNIFIDLGCYYGKSLNYFIDTLKINQNWQIYAFEPNPLIDNEKHIKDLKNKNLDITIYKKAAWIKNDKLLFKQYGSNGVSGGSLLADTYGDKNYNDFFNSIYVDTIDILEFINSLKSSYNIYIKMDIEYSEYPILEYMLIKGWPKNIKKIWIDWHGKNEKLYFNKIKYLSELISANGTELKVLN